MIICCGWNRCLGYSNEKRGYYRKNEVFEFKIFDSPHAMYNDIRKKEAEKRIQQGLLQVSVGNGVQNLIHNGELIKDVVIGDFAMPWETHGQNRKTTEGLC